MLLRGNFSEIEKGTEELVNTGKLEFLTDEITIIVTKGESGLKITGKDAKYEITYGEKADFFRSLSLLNGKISSGENEVDVNEERLLTVSGIMIDCSRNAVLKVETVKDIIRKISAMGLNMAMLYTEDTYEIEGYPYFGYLRGAYTKEELIEIDRYGLLFGVEMVPCIQTLGHLAAALRWPFANNIRENFHTLLVGEDETYALIRKMIERCRECFTTNKIHIGMDEAPSVGKGAYLEKYGYRDRFELLEMHLKKVIEITNEFGFEPMMWSDIYFRLASKKHAYYDLEVEFPENLPDMIPENVAMVYWDYSGMDKNTYEIMMKNHNLLKKEIVFAGGIRRWVGLSVNYKKSFIATHAALQTCHKEGIKKAFATLWVDDGGEVNVYTTLLGMQLYGEYTYHREVTQDELFENFKLCTGYNAESFTALDLDIYPDEWCHKAVWGGGATISKNVFYQDVLLGLYDKNVEIHNLPDVYRERLRILNDASVPKGLEKLYDYHKQLLKVLIVKSHIGVRMIKAYKTDDRETLNLIAQELSELQLDMKLLHKLMRDLWMSTNKPFGIERIETRYGGLILRMEAARGRILDYLGGKINCIEELNAERLMYGGDAVCGTETLIDDQFYPNFAMPAPEGFVAR